MDPQAEKPATRVISACPLFLVADVVQAAEHYRDKLGFAVLDYYGNPPCFVFVIRDFVQIMLKTAGEPGQVRPNGQYGVWDAYFWVKNINALRDEFVSRGAKIVEERPNTPYNAHEVELDDLDGHRLCFAQDTTPKPN